MTLLAIGRFFAGLLSLVLLATAGYLLWSWQEGETIRDAAGALHRDRDAWRLWTGLALLAWSFFGRFALLPLIAKPDERPTRAERGPGDTLTSSTGSSLYVEAYGRQDAPTIVLTHGWGMDSTFWRYAREDLADRFRVITWDLPGMGRSKAFDASAISLDAFATDLAAVLQASGSRPVTLVGHSIGGMIIQTLMRDHPDLRPRLASAILLNTTYTNPLKTMVLSRLLLALQRPLLEPAVRLSVALSPLLQLMKWQSYLSGSSHLVHRLGFGLHVTRSQLEHVTLLATRNSTAAMARGDLAMFHWDASGVVGRAGVRTLVVGGELDIVTKAEAGRTIAGDNPTAGFSLIPEVNHMGPMERADIYNALIAEFALAAQPSASTDLRPAAEEIAADVAAQQDAPPSPSGARPILH